jgi:hypothetical protein
MRAHAGVREAVPALDDQAPDEAARALSVRLRIPLTFPFLGMEAIEVTLRMAWWAIRRPRPAKATVVEPAKLRVASGSSADGRRGMMAPASAPDSPEPYVHARFSSSVSPPP